MKNRLVFFHLFICSFWLLNLNAFSAQNQNKFLQTFAEEPELLDSLNQISTLGTYDFSSVWMQTENKYVYGIIGKDNQRLRIKFTEIKQSENPLVYRVKGKSMVKGVICDFQGSLNVRQILQYQKIENGLDNEDLSDRIKKQGILIAEYVLNEDSLQTHSGQFTGTLYSKWYLGKDNQIKYDDIKNYSDGYTNNNFVGIWTSYNSGKTKICNWGDYRVPMCNNDFDMGAAYFFVSEKYRDKGWEDFSEGYYQNTNDEYEKWWE